MLTLNLLLGLTLVMRQGQVFLMMTLSMTTFSLGWPSPGPLALSVPALATFWMILSPLTTVPKGV